MFDFDSSTAEREADGIWKEYGGGEFLIAHMGNLNFQRVFASLQRPYNRQIEKNKLDPEIALNIMCKAVAKTILIDWRGVVDAEGNEVKYTRELAEDVLRRNAALRRFVQDVAVEIENYNEEEVEELGK